MTTTRLGLRANAPQFALLVLVNALVGAMLGQERTVLPLLAGDEFGVGAHTAALTFIVAFGTAKALANLAAGSLSDRWGRRPVLVGGWALAVPVPLLLIWAPTWGWVVVANLLLGVSQGLTWSTTVVMKIDLAGPARRGLAMGLNEAAGYGAVAAMALASGFVAERHGLRPAPFLLGLVVAVVGLALSAVAVRETRGHALLEARLGARTAPARPADAATDAATAGAPSGAGADGEPDGRTVFALTSLREPSLSAASQAGLVNNLNDGLAWGLFPVLFAGAGLGLGQIGVLAAAYPAVWGVGQVVTGGLSDRWGRKPLVTAGMLVQAAALAVVAVADSFGVWLAAAGLLGLGTAMVYPTLLAVVGDVAHPTWRARAVGVYRLWRDLGFAVGALLAGLLADAWGVRAAVVVVAVLTGLSGVVVAVRMRETHRRAP